MRYPGYLLNPGDMFQVRPQSVMYAIGAPKQAESDVIAEDGEVEEAAPQAVAEAETASVDERTPKQILKDLMVQSKSVLANAKQGLSAKRKQDLRALSKNIKKLMSQAGRSEVDTDSVEQQFDEIQRQLRLARDNQEAGTSAPPSEQSAEQREKAAGAASTGSDAETSIKDVKEEQEFGKKDESLLRRALQALQRNPIDESKPYATPWTPREYLSAFAFIPRYLEVNQNICAAVYLRHPVARKGFSEVPTPFAEQANANAFAWYLRRR
jgi:hypothetical protein